MNNFKKNVIKAKAVEELYCTLIRNFYCEIGYLEKFFKEREYERLNEMYSDMDVDEFFDSVRDILSKEGLAVWEVYSDILKALSKI